MTELLGRDTNAQDVKGYIQEFRLVTLFGSAGIGKTRLAVRVGEELLDNTGILVPDGVWLVELVSAASDESEDGLWARLEVGLKAMAKNVQGNNAKDRVLRLLSKRRLVLILDNCEHIVASCCSVVATLISHSNCSNLRILTTTRHPLGLTGEKVYEVSSLSYPAKARVETANARVSFVRDYRNYSAVKLFEDRARDTASWFAISENNAACVVRMCTRLDGIPLAIELAAAHVYDMPLSDIEKGLDKALELLAIGDPSKPQRRDQTIEATLQWSYNLLNMEQRSLFQILSVFVGGWERDAAQQLYFAAEMDVNVQKRFISTYRELVMSALIAVERVSLDMEDKDESISEDNCRHRLLEIVRQYAAIKLAESGNANDLRVGHLKYFLHEASKAEKLLTSIDQTHQLRLVEREYENLKAAMAFCLSMEDDDSFAALTTALSWFWYVCGHLREGITWLKRAIDSGENIDPSLRAKNFNALGDMLYRLGDYNSAKEHYNSSFMIWCSLDVEAAGMDFSVRSNMALLKSNLAFAYGELEDLDEAERLENESLTIKRSLSDQRGICISTYHLGRIALARGELSTASLHLKQSLVIARQNHDDYYKGLILYHQGVIQTAEGNLLIAFDIFFQTLEAAMVVRSTWGIAFVVFRMACLATVAKNSMHALLLFGVSKAIRERVGFNLPPLEQRAYEASLLRIHIMKRTANHVEKEGDKEVIPFVVIEQYFSSLPQWQKGTELPIEKVLDAVKSVREDITI